MAGHTHANPPRYASYAPAGVKHYFVAAPPNDRAGWDGRCIRCGEAADNRSVHFDTKGSS